MNAARMVFDNLDHYGQYEKLLFEGSSYTNTECLRLSCSLAALLRLHGVERDHHVAVMMLNSPLVEAAFQAAWILGAVIVPITPQLGVREVAFMLSDARVSLILTSPALEDVVRQACAGTACVKKVLVCGPEMESQLAGIPALEHLENRSPQDLALLLYTSGTTGTPKGVMLTHENVLFGVEAITRRNPGIPRHRLLHSLPLSHVYGVIVMNVCNAWGWTTILMPRFDPLSALRLIEQHRVTRIFVVPTMLVYLLHCPERERFDTSSLQNASSGGASLPEEVRLEFERVFQTQVLQGYGMSETAAVATGYAFDEPFRKSSVGRALPGIEIAIQDVNGNLLPPEESGEVVIRGPNIMSGYWNNPDATASYIRGGWLLSGDIGYLDSAGYLYITDRKKDLIIKGGENISPREIEEAIQSHPAVAEVSVVGIPDPVFGEEICAVIVLRAGAQATADEIRAHAEVAITRFKLPGKIVFTDSLPKSPVGKILKREVRKQAAGPAY